MLELRKETEGKTAIYRDFGAYVKTEKDVFYKIKKVYIFSNNKVYMIDNYFYDNIKDYLIINGETPRKNKIDLTIKSNFVVKAEQERFDYETMYNLYINADLNNYKFNDLKLINNGLYIYYYLNDVLYNHCIGWNNKTSNNIKYSDDVKKLYNSIQYFDNNERFEQSINDYIKAYKKYKKAIEKEKTYNAYDYKYFYLASGTDEEENKMILKNNGFDI